MAILLLFTTYLYAMSYGDPEHAELIKFLDDKCMKSVQFYLSVFILKPIHMGLLFIYSDSFACFVS